MSTRSPIRTKGCSVSSSLVILTTLPSLKVMIPFFRSIVPCLISSRVGLRFDMRVSVFLLSLFYDVLATYKLEVLYVGLASASIGDRMGTHLDAEEKRKGGREGVPFWFYYLLCPPKDVNRLERGWMNQSILVQGDIPILNKIYSPV